MTGIVVCAGGVRVAQRGAHLDPKRGWGLYLGPVGGVSLPTEPPVTSQRADGTVWRRHWAQPDRLVVDFIGLAVVAVDIESGAVAFDRRVPSDLEQHLLLDHILPLVLAHRGDLVVHGGVISRDEQAIVLVGATGAGKSTLTAYAWRHGWTLGGDDGAVLHPTDPPTVEPTYSTVRLTPHGVDLVGVDPASGTGVAGKLRLDLNAGAGYRLSPVSVRAIAVIEPDLPGSQARFEPLAAIDAHARLIGATFHADLDGRRRLPGVLDRLASIIEHCEVGRLVVPRGEAGLAAAEKCLQSLVAAVDGAASVTP